MNLSDELVAQADDVFVFSTHLVVAGRARSFDEVLRVGGGQSSLTVNLLAAYRHSDLVITFSDGTVHSLSEQRTSGTGKRHEQITHCVAAIRAATRTQRLTRAGSEWKSKGVITVGRELEDDSLLVDIGLIKRPPVTTVVLQRDFVLTNGRLSFNIKNCRARGILHLGMFKSNRRAPDEVYASEVKTKFAKSRMEALKFSAAVSCEHDVDIVLALLNVAADPSFQL